MDATTSFESVPARILQVAARRIGGEQRLAEALQVQPMQLACWLGNLQHPPRSVLVRALAIVLRPQGEKQASA
jgi:hypothetical protein